MRLLIPALALLLCASPSPAQEKEEAATVITDEQLAAKRALESLLRSVPGTRTSGMGLVDGRCRVIVSCEDYATKEEARKRVGGDTYRGLDIVWSISPSGNYVSPSTPAVKRKIPAKSSAQAPQGPPVNDTSQSPWNAKVTDCDIIRTHLKMKRVSRPAGNGRYWKPCSVNRRRVEGPAGGYSYEYTKHRGDCPIRLGRVRCPSWADNFIRWVFAKGFTPVARGGFLYPNGLRGDNKQWDRAASEDLKTRLPYIREKAEWKWTVSGYVRTRRGSYPVNGGYPGLNWSWGVPAPPPAGPSVATGGGCACAGCGSPQK